MVTAMRVVGDKEGKGDDENDGGGNEGGVQRRGRWQRLINGDEGDGQATAMRVMVTAMATATAKGTTWVMVMVTRQPGNEEGKGEGGKGNGDDDEGGLRATERARAIRQWQRQQGWRASGRRRRRRGQWLR